MAGGRLRIVTGGDSTLRTALALLDATEKLYNRSYLVSGERQYRTLDKLADDMTRPEVVIPSEHRLQVDQLRSVASFEILLSGLFTVLSMTGTILGILITHAKWQKTRAEKNKIEAETDKLKAETTILQFETVRLAAERLQSSITSDTIRDFRESLRGLRQLGVPIDTSQLDRFLRQEEELSNRLKLILGTDEQRQTILRIRVEPLKWILRN